MKKLAVLLGITILVFASCKAKPDERSWNVSPNSLQTENTATAEGAGKRHDEQPKETYIAPEATSGVKKIDMVFVEGGGMEIQGKQVTLDSFYMNRYELSQYEYIEAHNWAFHQGYFAPMGIEWPHSDREDNTAGVMIVIEALAVCNYLSLMENLKPVYYASVNGDRKPLVTGRWGNYPVEVDYSADGYRLPTEAEWEYAARGGQKSRGFVYAGSDDIDEVAWYFGNNDSVRYPLPGQKKPNELGLYDMSGNAAEWVIEPYQEKADMEPAHNPGRKTYYAFGDTPQTFWLQKGGHVDGYGSLPLESRSVEYFTPQARLAANSDFDPPWGRESKNRYGAIRLVM